MRWTRIALLLFGAGLLLGLVVVAFELDPMGRVASWIMALGIAAIPAGLLADWRRASRPAPTAKRRSKPRARLASQLARHSVRKPARARR